MRFESIELLRYGRFSGERICFPRQEHDFHLIIGDNEAGKSTLRQAFHDLLFGIPMNSPMSFLHAGPELALNAVLGSQSGELTMGRRRKRGGGLVDADEKQMAPEVMDAWLGGVTPAFHERMFGLDHRRLEQGSRAMLQAGDDVDSVLFQAAAGLATLNGVLASLREEAASLWTPHHSRTRSWYAASDRLKEADKALKAATVRPTAWADAHRESRRLNESFAQARDECTRLRAQLRELERLRRLAPVLAQIRELEALLRAEHAASDEATMLLALEADILRLDETRLRVAEHQGEIGHCSSHIGLLGEQLAALLRQLGRATAHRPGEDIGAVAATLPVQPLRHEIRQLLAEGRELDMRCDASVRAQQARRAEVQELRARIDAFPSLAVGDDLRRAVEAATAAGDMAAAIDTLQHKAVMEQAELDRRLHALQQLDVSVLAHMAPWPSQALLEHGERRRQLQTEVDATLRRLRDAELELREAQLKEQQFRRTHQAVSHDDVMAARRDRDELWRALASGETPLATYAERYASLVLRADVLADRHLGGVEQAARLQAMEHECERLGSAVQGLQRLHESASETLAAHEREWHAACMQRRLPAMSPTELQGWQQGRETALQAHERLLGTQTDLAALQQRHDVLLQALLAALHAEGVRLEPSEQASAADPVSVASTLQQACSLGRGLLQRADGAIARRETLAEQLLRLESLLPGLEQECARDAASHQALRDRRQVALRRAGLPEDADDAYIEAAINLLSDADELLGKLREREAHRDRLQSELQHFLRAAQSLAQRLGTEEPSPDQADMQVGRWVAQLAPLRAAVREREQARVQLAALQARLLEEAEGRDRQQVEAELAPVEWSELAARADVLSVQLDQAEQQRDRLAVECEQARAALDAITGADDAAQAEARRQEALADMGQIAERYVRVHAQYRLLEHITERYRERSQGPLLAHAGRLFSELTLGAHAGLVVDGEAATLWAKRADGRLVPLEGLSDGTRDQLYLALRLAALELYLDSAAAMPFIADDLFINYDDGRALAGLRQLVEVSKRTQVIFLTHHAHMVDLTRENLQGRVNVIDLHARETAGYTASPN